MSDFDEDGRRIPDYEEMRDAYEERRRRSRIFGCACGYPDWPGSCPGTANCPVANYGRDDDDDDE